MTKTRVLLLAMLLAVACTNEQRATFSALAAAQKALAAELKPAEVKLDLASGRHVVVTVINSPLNKAPEEERAARARKVADIVAAHLKQAESIEVAFVNRSGGFDPSVTKSVTLYVFKPPRSSSARR